MDNDDDGSEVVEGFKDESRVKSSLVETLEQKVHELDGKLRQVRVERDNVMADNDELMEQLEVSNSAQSAGNMRVGELRNETTKLTEDVSRLDYACASQEHELKTLSDKVCDLNNLKETVKELQEDTKQFKEDFGRMRTHLNVAAKLELQTQEKMYESRLHHLENVLEEMKQREGHFMRLAEETAVLKDQVDSLRELSVMSLKGDENRVDSASDRRGGEDDDEGAKAHAARAAQQYAAIMESCSGSPLPHMLMAGSPVVMSEENSLAREIETSTAAAAAAAAAAARSSPDIEEPPSSSEPSVRSPSSVRTPFEEPLALSDENANDGGADDLDVAVDAMATEYDNARLMLLDVEEKPQIKVSGTLKLRSRDTLTDKKSHDGEVGCFPNAILSVWSTVFD